MDIKIDASKVVIKTERLKLRAFAEADLDDLYAYASVPGVGEMAGWPHHESIGISEGVLRIFIEEKNVFAICRAEDDRVIGSLGFHYSWANEDDRYKDLTVKEIGYVLSKDSWGRGLMPEAVGAVIDYGFNELKIGAFTCGCIVKNNQSRRVIEKCGFQFISYGVYYAKQLQRHFKDMKYILINGGGPAAFIRSRP